MVVNDGGSVTCNGSEHPLDADRLLRARELSRELAEPAELGLELPPGPGANLSYRVRMEAGTVALLGHLARQPAGVPAPRRVHQGRGRARVWDRSLMRARASPRSSPRSPAATSTPCASWCARTRRWPRRATATASRCCCSRSSTSSARRPTRCSRPSPSSASSRRPPPAAPTACASCWPPIPPRCGERTPEGFTPLGLAAFLGGPEAVRVLLEHGADADDDADNPFGVRPVHAASAAHDHETMRLLLEAGADPTSASAAASCRCTRRRTPTTSRWRGCCSRTAPTRRSPPTTAATRAGSRPTTAARASRRCSPE